LRDWGSLIIAAQKVYLTDFTHKEDTMFFTDKILELRRDLDEEITNRREDKIKFNELDDRFSVIVKNAADILEKMQDDTKLLADYMQVKFVDTPAKRELIERGE
jgi:hypothetical protein